MIALQRVYRPASHPSVHAPARANQPCPPAIGADKPRCSL
jgi:hypothetical protein